MDPSVAAAMAKWPNVPDCRGWLSLDRRGQWRLQGSPVRHAGLADFIGRNYECDKSGAWFMQNGPQRVWVEVEATPWVFRLTGNGADSALVTHTGEPAGELLAVWLVDGETLCLQAERGFGMVDDRDLQPLLGHLRRDDGAPTEDLETASLALHWHGARLPLQRCADAALEAIGGFRRLP